MKFYNLFEKTAGFSEATITKALIKRLNSLINDYEKVKNLEDAKSFFRKGYRTGKQVFKKYPNKTQSIIDFEKYGPELAKGVSLPSSYPAQTRFRKVLLKELGKENTKKLAKGFDLYDDGKIFPKKFANIVKTILKDPVLENAIRNRKQIGIKDL